MTAGVQPRFIVIRYPAYGGVVEERLSSRAGARSDKLIPYHFVIEDAYGEQTTVQAEGRAQAEAAQTALRKRQQAASEALEATRKQLIQVGLLTYGPLYAGFDGTPLPLGPSWPLWSPYGAASCDACAVDCYACPQIGPGTCCRP